MPTTSAFSSGPGSSSAANWLASSAGGMKWSVRAASRDAIMSWLPSR